MDASVENAAARSPGQLLAAERERLGLAPADIAQRLHMSVWQIDALERGDYARLPSGPFLRGFMRNYAKVVGLPADEVLARLAERAPPHPAPGIVVPSQNIRFDPLSERIANPYVKAATIAVTVVAFALAAMYWWLNIRNPVPAPVTARKPAPAQTVALAPATKPVTEPTPSTAASTPPSAPSAAAPMPPASVAPPAATPAPPPAAVPSPASTAPAPAATGAARVDGARIKLRFRGKSWVEVKDSAGRVLLTGVNDPGSEAEVSGRPPLRVIVGNAGEVSMLYNDREFDLQPHMREAVARVTLD